MFPKSPARKIISNIFAYFRNSICFGHRSLIYHSIGSNVLGDPTGLNSLSKELFVEHIQFLKDFKIVNSCSSNLNYNELNISLTFDDGYTDNLVYVAPILVENEIPFTVFITTDYIENEKNCMSKHQLTELSKLSGVTIGSHTKSHPHLTKLNNNDLEMELLYSKHFIEDLIGIKVCSIAYPYGDVNQRVATEVERLGYQYGFCSHFDTNKSNRNKFFINRCFIHKNDGRKILKQKIVGDWDWYKYRKIDPYLR